MSLSLQAGLVVRGVEVPKQSLRKEEPVSLRIPMSLPRLASLRVVSVPVASMRLALLLTTAAILIHTSLLMAQGSPFQESPAVSPPSSEDESRDAPETPDPQTPHDVPAAVDRAEVDPADDEETPKPLLEKALLDQALAGDEGAVTQLRNMPPSVYPQVVALLGDPTPQQQKQVGDLIRHWIDSALEYSMKEEGGLIYHGQFAALKPLGARGARELLAVLRQEDDLPEKRRRASIAIGDIGDRTLLPELQKIMDDFLTEEWVIDATGYLMARLGDRRYVDERIEAANEGTQLPATPRYLPTLIAAHTELAQLNYRTGEYEKAIEHYRTKLRLLKELEIHIRPELKSGVEAEIALLHYNLACSLSLAGQVEESFRALHTAMPHADVTIDMVQADGDLRALRADPRYQQWLRELMEREKESEQAHAPVAVDFARS